MCIWCVCMVCVYDVCILCIVCIWYMCTVCVYGMCVYGMGMCIWCGYVGECGWCVGAESERDLESRGSHVRGVGIHSEQFLIVSTISY